MRKYRQNEFSLLNVLNSGYRFDSQSNASQKRLPFYRHNVRTEDVSEWHLTEIGVMAVSTTHKLPHVGIRLTYRPDPEPTVRTERSHFQANIFSGEFYRRFFLKTLKNDSLGLCYRFGHVILLTIRIF